MGWRTDEAFEEAERDRERAFVASLSPRDRLRLRLWQACGVGIVVCLFLLMMAFAFPARSAPIEPGSVSVIDGDTIRIGSNTFRLVGFNTPEPGLAAKCEAERTLAAPATFRLRQLVIGEGLA